MFQIIFEFGLFLLVVLTGVFQVLIPLSQSRKVFPMFRRDMSEAERALKNAGQRVAVKDVQLEAWELKKKSDSQKSK
jgi:hypothetical protein